MKCWSMMLVLNALWMPYSEGPQLQNMAVKIILPSRCFSAWPVSTLGAVSTSWVERPENINKREWIQGVSMEAVVVELTVIRKSSTLTLTLLLLVTLLLLILLLLLLLVLLLLLFLFLLRCLILIMLLLLFLPLILLLYYIYSDILQISCLFIHPSEILAVCLS